MIRIAIIAMGIGVFATTALAQGQGGYANGAPGTMIIASPANTVKHARHHHMTNDTAGGTSSVDKSGQTREGGASAAGAQGSASQALGAHAPGNTGATKTLPVNQ
jgi:hypothetical protein